MTTPKPGAKAALSASSVLFARLTPIKNGPGVVVCEPVPVGVDAAAAHFGAGCGRWLHVAVAGHGELGQTPSWRDIFLSISGMKQPNLQVGAAYVRDLRRTLGATHAVIGQITAQGENYTLTWHLVDIENKTSLSVGAPLMLTGTREQIVAGLPGVARDIARRLGVQVLHVPNRVEATPDDLTFLGALPRVPFPSLPLKPEVTARLLKLAEREPLASVLALQWGKLPEPVMKVVLNRVSDNLVELGMMAWNDGPGMWPLGTKGLPILIKFPHNYQATCIDTWRDEWGRYLNSARQSAETSVRCAPANPFAWLNLAEVMSLQANEIRQSRYISDMTPDELASTFHFYPLLQVVGRHATNLDPQNGLAWLSLCQAMVFNGDPNGPAAFWKALTLRPDDPQVLNWGMQMFQPKWGGDPNQLLKVVEMALSKTDKWLEVRDSISLVLKYLDMREQRARTVAVTFFGHILQNDGIDFEKQPGLRNTVMMAWDVARSHSAEAASWLAFSTVALDAADKIRLGRALNELSQPEGRVLQHLYSVAWLSAQLATSLDGDNATAWLLFSRATVLSSKGKRDGPDTALLRALELEPKNAAIYRWGLNMSQPKWNGDPSLLWDLARSAAADQKLLDVLAPDISNALQTIKERSASQSAVLAKAQTTIAQLEPRDDVSTQQRLTLYFLDTHQQSRARTAVENWVRLAPNDAEAHFQYGGLLQNTRDMEGALKQYREALKFDPQHVQALLYAGSILNYQLKFAEAQPLLQRATELLPLWILPHVYLGETLNGLGQRRAARTQWQAAADLGSYTSVENESLVRARKLLETFPADNTEIVTVP